MNKKRNTKNFTAFCPLRCEARNGFIRILDIIMFTVELPNPTKILIKIGLTRLLTAVKWIMLGGSNGFPNNAFLALVPALPRLQPLVFQQHKRPNGTQNVRPLCRLGAGLTSLDRTALLQAAMILFDSKGVGSKLLAGHFGHRRVRCRPERDVLHVAGNTDEHFDHAVCPQVNDLTFRRDVDKVNLPIARFVGFNHAIGLQSRQPVPTIRPHGFEIVGSAVPTVEADISGRKLAVLCRLEHLHK